MGVNPALQMRSLALFGVRNWMCGVRACENVHKRVSHGETVRVGSSVILLSAFRVLDLWSAQASVPSRSGRMASWLWLRCVLGPHVQRIHRAPDQPRPEGRGRRVGASECLCVCVYNPLWDQSRAPCPRDAAAGAAARKCQGVCYGSSAVTAAVSGAK